MVSIWPVVSLHLLGRYFNSFNAKVHQNIIQQYYLAQDKYWVTQSGYFRLANIVVLSIDTKYGNLLYCRGVSELNMDKKISILDHNSRTIYIWINIQFSDELVSPNLYLPPITIGERPDPYKRSKYTPDLLPYLILKHHGSIGDSHT